MNSLFKNSVYYVMYRIINVIYPLLTATYVSRVLKPSGVGEAALAQNIVIFLVALAMLGIPNYGVREISICKSSSLNTLFSELFLINAISTTIISVIYIEVINVFDMPINTKLYNIYGIILVLNIFNVDWFYQAKEEFKYITIRSAIVKLSSMLAIFTLVKDEEDICMYGLIFALAYAGNYVFNVVNLKRYIKFTFRNLHIKRHLRNIFVLGVTSISNEIYVMLDSLMLGVLATNTELGYYTNSIKLVRILINVVTAMGTVLLPRLSKIKEEKDSLLYNSILDRVVKILLWVTIPCTLGILLLAESINVVLFGNSFLAAADILKILSLLIIPRAFSNIMLQVLICLNKDTSTSKIYFSGMLINCMLNMILIPANGAQGAAAASVISEIYICFVLFHFAKHKIKVHINFQFIVSVIFAATIMTILVLAARNSMNVMECSSFVILFINICIGVISYVVVSLILKNEIALFLTSKLIKKLR